MSTPPRGADLRRLRREVAQAGDDQRRRIVLFVDRLAERGDADALIAPLRPRLARIAPGRPLGLPRLLFLPLDKLIVDAGQWKPGMPCIPRSVVPALAEAVLAAIGHEAEGLRRLTAGHSMADTDVVMTVGGVLWPAAAATLRDCAPPPGWTQATGLRPDDFVAFARPVAGLLAHGPTLYRMTLRDAEALAPASIGVVLAAARRSGGDTPAMLLALLLALVPDPATVLRFAEPSGGQPAVADRATLDRAIDFMLDMAGDGAPSGAEAAPDFDDLRSMAVLVDGLEVQRGQRSPRAAKVLRVQQRLDGFCRQKFETAAEMLKPPAAAPAEPATPIGDAEVNQMESAARDLRRLEAVGKRLTVSGYYDAGLRRSAERLAASPGLTSADLLRLTEILLGSDAAARR